MKSVCHLLSTRRTETSAFCVEAAAIARNRRNLWMLL
jgi:hypothetical protein